MQKTVFTVVNTRTNTTAPGAKKASFTENLVITDGRRAARFTLTGEDKIESRFFREGMTSSDTLLRTGTHKQVSENDSDFHFVKMCKAPGSNRVARWGYKQNKALEYADMLQFILMCEGLPVVHLDSPGVVQYKVIDGKVEGIITNEVKNLFMAAQDALERHQRVAGKNYPLHYVEIIEREADMYYMEIVKRDLADKFLNYLEENNTRYPENIEPPKLLTFKRRAS